MLARERIGPGGLRGLQIRWWAPFGVHGGSIPPAPDSKKIEWLSLKCTASERYSQKLLQYWREAGCLPRVMMQWLEGEVIVL